MQVQLPPLLPLLQQQKLWRQLLVRVLLPLPGLLLPELSPQPLLLGIQQMLCRLLVEHRSQHLHEVHVQTLPTA
jgi:hypothetical protein